MPLAIEEYARHIRSLLERPEVREAMRARCDETQHEYENCCSAWLEIYRRCKWCGDRR